MSRQARHNARKRAERRASGLCRDCGAPSKVTRCRSCQDALNAYKRDWRRKLVEDGKPHEPVKL